MCVCVCVCRRTQPLCLTSCSFSHSDYLQEKNFVELVFDLFQLSGLFFIFPRDHTNTHVSVLKLLSSDADLWTTELQGHMSLKQDLYSIYIFYFIYLFLSISEFIPSNFNVRHLNQDGCYKNFDLI